MTWMGAWVGQRSFLRPAWLGGGKEGEGGVGGWLRARTHFLQTQRNEPEREGADTR